MVMMIMLIMIIMMIKHKHYYDHHHKFDEDDAHVISMMIMNLVKIGPPLEKYQNRQAYMARKKTHRMKKIMMMRIMKRTQWRMKISMMRKKMIVARRTL